ncbi:hypothetical protein AAGV33_05755 [Flavobacterium sp. FBOR7N2.3]|uniref:DUF4142 domain-containing protein n=1 Tax=Flavobacterium magnesitis TaxID=3138077 RepID=A0ABV4TIS6_9FLAO
MKILRSKHYLLLFLLSFIYSVIFISCEKKNKSTKETIKLQKTEDKKVVGTNIEATEVSEQILIQIAESNLKVVAIAQKAQEGKLKKSTRNALEEVEENHIQIKNKIRKIAKDNFIIIPNTLYDTSILKNFIDEMSTSLYLKKLENSLNLELELYKKINTTILNKDLKTLCEQAMPIIKKNIAAVNKEQKQLQ